MSIIPCMPCDCPLIIPPPPTAVIGSTFTFFGRPRFFFMPSLRLPADIAAAAAAAAADGFVCLVGVATGVPSEFNTFLGRPRFFFTGITGDSPPLPIIIISLGW